MKDRVVCIRGGDWKQQEHVGSNNMDITFPVKDEIYTVECIFNRNGHSYLILKECGWAGFESKNFRPVDTTFGYVVCSTIEEQIEYEKVMVPTEMDWGYGK